MIRTERLQSLVAGPRGMAGGGLSRALLLLPALLLVLLAAAPILAIFGYLGSGADGIWGHLVQTVLFEYLWNSLLLCLGVALLAGVIGAGCAWLVTMYRFPGRNLFVWALFLPLAMPAYVLAYAYTDFFDVAGPVQTTLRAVTGWSVRDYPFFEIRSLGGAVFVLSMALYPYVYALARAAFVEQSQCALEVSRTLGCTGWSAFQRVGLPLARPAVAAGLSFVVMETLADFGAVSFFGVPTFTTGIYRAWYGLSSPAAAAQLSSLLLAFVLLVFVAERMLRGRARFAANTIHIYRKQLPALRGAPAWLATAACSAAVFSGFLLPAAILLAMLGDGLETVSVSRLAELLQNTVLLGASAALLLVAAALSVLFAVRREGGPVARLLLRLATLGYAVPGAVIGVGILLVLTSADRLLAGLLAHRGLILSGTLVAVLYGYLVRFFAVAYNPLDAGWTKIGPHLGDAARTLGHRPLETFLRVQLPLLRPAVLGALLLVFVDVMKELPATLILRPFDFDTLAIEAYRLATTERLDGAALPSLLIVLVGLAPVVMLCRMTEGRRAAVR